MTQCVDAAQADEVENASAGHGGRVLAVPPLTDEVAAPRGERERPVPEGREVDDAADDGGGARDRRARREAPAQRAGVAVEGIEAVVVRADQDEPSPDGGRRVHVAAGAESPEDAAGRGRECVDVAVERADEDASAGDGSGRVEVAESDAAPHGPA